MASMALKSPTSIEYETYQALQEMGFDYEPQVQVGRFLVDAFIPSLNTVVECQGDYWHCNPKVYPDGPQYDHQRRRIASDKRKAAALKERGYTLIELWESDINEIGAVNLLRRELLTIEQSVHGVVLLST